MSEPALPPALNLPEPSKTDEPGSAAQVPARVPAPAPAPAEPPTAPDGPLSADEERQLGELQARAAAARQADGVQLKVEEPHSEFTYAGHTVRRAFTFIPRHLASAFHTAAGEAGVTLTQEE